MELEVRLRQDPPGRRLDTRTTRSRAVPSTCRTQREVEHGHELPLPAGGRSDDIRDYLKFSKIRDSRYSHRIPILVLPVGKRIEFNLAAADVVRTFWVPEFLYKRDVMPGPSRTTPIRSSRSRRSSVRARSSVAARRCAAPTTR